MRRKKNRKYGDLKRKNGDLKRKKQERVLKDFVERN